MGSTAERSDGELLSATAARDGRAFGHFYRRHLPAVVGYLVRETRDREVAADLTAEVFAAVLLSAGRFQARGDASAAPWVRQAPYYRLASVSECPVGVAVGRPGRACRGCGRRLFIGPRSSPRSTLPGARAAITARLVVMGGPAGARPSRSGLNATKQVLSRRVLDRGHGCPPAAGTRAALSARRSGGGSTHAAG
jgi:Sigma-70 region 2